jgi:hypothetical protein
MGHFIGRASVDAVGLAAGRRFTHAPGRRAWSVLGEGARGAHAGAGGAGGRRLTGPLSPIWVVSSEARIRGLRSRPPGGSTPRAALGRGVPQRQQAIQLSGSAPNKPAGTTGRRAGRRFEAKAHAVALSVPQATRGRRSGGFATAGRPEPPRARRPRREPQRGQPRPAPQPGSPPQGSPGPPSAAPARNATKPETRARAERSLCSGFARRREARAYAPTRNTGWSGAIRRSSSSDESALTPPKNAPISQLQRFR